MTDSAGNKLPGPDSFPGPEGALREVTVVSLSLRGFAGLAESTPAGIMEFLAAYLEALDAVGRTHGGRRIRALGDMILWVQGPGGPDHAARACHLSIDIAHRVHELRGSFPRLPPIEVDIGISTGPAITGEIADGPAVIGRVVELASHLRSLNPVYGTQILLSGSTRTAAGGTLAVAREIDLLQIRGRPAPVPLFELMLPLDQIRPPWLDDFTRGYDLLRAGLRPQARAVFRNLSERNNDPVSRLLSERCAAPQRRRDD